MKKSVKYDWGLVEVLRSSATSEVLLSKLLQDLLTPQELQDLAIRWQIVKQLHKKVPQRSIARNLGVSIATITRGSRVLLDPNGGFNQLLKKISL